MLIADALQSVEQFLEKRPAAPGVDHGVVFPLAGGGVLAVEVWGGLVQVFGAEEAAAEGFVCEEFNVVLLAQGEHLLSWTDVY